MEASTSSGGSTGLLSGMSKRWQIGARVLVNLQRIVNFARTSGDPQMTGDYPRYEDDIARAITLDSEWTGKKTSAYEGVNVGAFALMDTSEGEVVGTAFNVGGKADWERTEKTMDAVFGSADLPTDYVPIKKKEGRKQDVHTHAEMKIADLSGAPSGTYIGISKECCLCCAAALLVQGKYRFGGCHGQAFDNWPMPSFIRNNPANLRKFMGEEAWALYSLLTAGKKIGLPEPDLYQGDFLDWLETAWGTLS